uniref:Uncharacterized protein n=1 Tax=Oryza glaberrima TaxID=4538 RepID=I1PDE1_ORYGL
MTRVRILEGQLRSKGIRTRFREELRSRWSRIPGDKVGYEMAYGRWTPCGRDLRNRLHVVCVQASVFANGIEREKLEVRQQHATARMAGAAARQEADFDADFDTETDTC